VVDVALVKIEYPKDGKTIVVPAGHRIPGDFPEESLAELKEYGSIGSEAEYEASAAEEARQRESITITRREYERLRKAAGEMGEDDRDLVSGDSASADDRRS
jgi:hypothetical protein